MCPWVGSRGPSFGRQLRGLLSCVEYLLHQGYRSRSSTVRPPHPCGLSCGASLLGRRPLLDCVLAPLSPVASMTPGDVCHCLDAAWPGSDQWPWGTAPATGPVGRLGCPSASDPWGVGSFLSLGRPMCARVCAVLGHLATVHRCARSVCSVACAASWATWLPFTSVPARWFALCVRCPGPLGSCSPVRPLGAVLCSCGVLGHLAPVHRCARWVCCVASAVSWATWLLFTGAPAR